MDGAEDNISIKCPYVHESKKMKSNKIYLYIPSWCFIRNKQTVFSSFNFRTKKDVINLRFHS